MDKIFGLMGLAVRGRNLVSGEFSVETALKKNQAKLVIIASDASDNTKKHFRDMCNFRDVPLIVYGDKASIGHAISQESRASVAILDEGLSKAVLKEKQRQKIGE